MSEQDGLICALVLDGKGGGHKRDWSQIRSWTAEEGVLWVHLDRSGDEVQRWLAEDAEVAPFMVEALLSEEVRPRVLKVGDALLVNLRGVNLNPGADPEDMVAIRVWIEKNRILTVRHRRLMAVNDIREELAAGDGPNTCADFLVRLCDRLIDRMGPVIADIDDKVDELEGRVLGSQSSELRGQPARLRQATIALRRYLAPQRDAMARLPAEPVSWFTDADRAMLREIADRTLRYVEDLDSARERAAVSQDELNTRLSEQMNRTMYVLTVVAAVLLPPSLITGLFGINVAGMPGVETPWAFSGVVVAIVMVATVEVIVLRYLKWI